MNARVAAGVLLATGLSAQGVFAQIDGVVRDERGATVPLARVHLLSVDGGYLSARLASENGTFSFAPAADAYFVEVYALGYSTKRVALGDLMSPLRVVVEPEPIDVEGVTVVAAAHPCPSAKDPVADSLWKAIATRYREPAPGETWASVAVVGGPSAEGGPSWVAVGSSQVSYARFTDSAPGERYSQAKSWSFPGEVGGSRRYASLESTLTPHFVSESFASAHHLGVVSNSPDDYELAFCSIEREGLRGSIRVVAGSIAEISWAFVTTDEEQVGVVVDFPSRPDSSLVRPLLLPARAKIWEVRVGVRSLRVHDFGRWFSGSQQEVDAALEPIYEGLIGGD